MSFTIKVNATNKEPLRGTQFPPAKDKLNRFLREVQFQIETTQAKREALKAKCSL